MFTDLPHHGDYRVIYADPPWKFKVWAPEGRADEHYATMPDDDIAAMPVGDLAARDAVLFLWVVQALLPEALQMIQSWGFTFKTVAFGWVKLKGKQDRLFYAGSDVKMGMGYHTRAGFEQCWLATRGKGYERLTKAEPQVVFSPLREHSRKPDEIAEAICRLAAGPRVELFARTQREGFDVWGNQTDKFGAVA